MMKDGSFQSPTHFGPTTFWDQPKEVEFTLEPSAIIGLSDYLRENPFIRSSQHNIDEFYEKELAK